MATDTGTPAHHDSLLDDPALQRNAGVGDGKRALGGDVVHGGEAPRHHRVALRYPADAGPDLADAPYAFVTRRPALGASLP